MKKSKTKENKKHEKIEEHKKHKSLKKHLKNKIKKAKIRKTKHGIKIAEKTVMHKKESGKKKHEKTKHKITENKIAIGSTNTEAEKSYRLNQQEVVQSYRELQKYFIGVYEEALKNNKKKDIRKLEEFQKEISEKVNSYMRHHSGILDLAEEVSNGINLLDSMSKAKVPETLKKEVAEEIRDSKKYEYIEHEKKVKARKHGVTTIKKKEDGEVVKSYDLEVDKAKVKVEIRKENLGFSYNLKIPEINLPTANLLNEIRNELITITEISMKELINPKAFFAIKKKFTDDAINIIKSKLPNIQEETEKFLVGILIQDMLGLSRIEFLINDPTLEEIVIVSSKEPIRVYNKEYGWLSTNLKVVKEEDIINYSNIIARRVGRQITVLTPLLDAHLVTGDRINAVLYPINTKGNTITIRKFARDPYTIVDLIENKTCDMDVACLLWLAIEYEMNFIISGGTASGKTVFLNACLPFIPPNHRIISIEDTRELMLPEFLYWTPLVTRTPNPEGKGAVTMLDLLINSLRMRPDRIILGEMRKHEEAMVLFEAMHTGHSVYATVHADSAAETISRLINPPLNVPPNLLKSVNLNVVMFRDRKKGIRRVLQIAEIEATKGEAKANIIYRWSPEEDKIVEHNESIKFYEDISRHTGMTQAEIKSNLKEKSKILSWLVKNKIRSLDNFGKIMNYYYKNKEFLIKAINSNKTSSVLNSEK